MATVPKKTSKTERVLSVLKRNTKQGKGVGHAPSRPATASSTSTQPPQPQPAPALSRVSTAPAIDSNAGLWQQAVSQAESDGDWIIFKGRFLGGQNPSSIDSIVLVLQDSLSRSQQSQWKVSVGGKDVILRDVIGSVVEYARIFKDVGNTVATCDPTKHAVLAWGLLQWLVQVCMAVLCSLGGPSRLPATPGH